MTLLVHSRAFPCPLPYQIYFFFTIPCELLQNNFSEEKIPLPNQQLYGAFKDRIRKLESNKNFDKTAIESRLGQEQSQVKDLFSVRNKAAHASLDGDEREVNFEDYQKLVGKVSTVISTLFDIRLMLQSLEK
ncbi:MAG: HEPN domain-containing protein [Pseudanabaena sp.]